MNERKRSNDARRKGKEEVREKKVIQKKDEVKRIKPKRKEGTERLLISSTPLRGDNGIRERKGGMWRREKGEGERRHI